MGTGKTKALRTLIKEAKKSNQRVLVLVARRGLARNASGVLG